VGRGARGAAQAGAAGVAMVWGGTLRDWIGAIALSGAVGGGLARPTTGYSFVDHTEIGLLFVTLAVLGPLVRTSGPIQPKSAEPTRLGLADFPT